MWHSGKLAPSLTSAALRRMGPVPTSDTTVELALVKGVWVRHLGMYVGYLTLTVVIPWGGTGLEMMYPATLPHTYLWQPGKMPRGS